MEKIFIPNCTTFLNGNTFLGSYRGLRFKLTPDTESSTLQAELWHGPKCYDLSQMERTETFPITPEGLEKLTAWLLENVEA